MTIKLNPPPLNVPGEWLQDKEKQSFFSQLINTIYQMWTALYGIRFAARIKTTDNTVTALMRTKLDLDRTVLVQAFIVARRTGGTAGTVGDSAFYVLTGAYKNISGVLTGIGAPDLVGGEDQVGWNVGFTTSGQDVVITVLGDTGNDVTWEGTMSTYQAGA